MTRHAIAWAAAVTVLAQAVAATTLASAQTSPPSEQPTLANSSAAAAPSPTDPRILVLPFNQDRIYSLTGYLGFQMMIEFEPGERIENVAVGDSLAWQVTPNRAATLLFVKPVATGSRSNMTVVTSLRRYNFEMTSRERSGARGGEPVYAVRFAYPPPPPAPPPAPPPPPPAQPMLERLNTAYSVERAPWLGAVSVFDDGAMTYFQFGDAADVPAVFAIGASGEEELVNVQTRGPFVVVDQIASAFVLRVGRRAVRVTNRAYRPDAPAQRSAR